MSDLDPVEIDTKAHYLKESAKEDIDYLDKAIEAFMDRDQLHEMIMEGNEDLTDAIYDLMNTFKDPDECCIKIFDVIENMALKRVGGS